MNRRHKTGFSKVFPDIKELGNFFCFSQLGNSININSIGELLKVLQKNPLPDGRNVKDNNDIG